MKRLSIRQQILLMSLLPLVGVMAFVGFYVYFNYVQELEWYFEQQSQAHTRLLGLYASEDLESGNEGRLQQLASGALEAPGVRSVRILDAKQQTMAHAGPLMQTQSAPNETDASREFTQHKTEKLLFMRKPVFRADNTSSQPQPPQQRRILGWVEVEYRRDHYAIPKYQTFLGSSLAILAAIFIIFTLASLIARRFQGRVGQLRQGVRALAQGFYDTHFHLKGQDELQYLANDLNAMKTALNSTFHELKSNLERSNTDLRETLESLEIQHIELDMARREAVEASRMKSEFLANTSHEIRTPLNSIIGFTNILLKSETDNRKKNYLETVRQSAETLLSIINDILDFSKIEAGKLLLDNIPLNLHELVEESFSSLAPMANQKQLKLAIFVDEALPYSLLGDPLRLRQIITNLLNNAIKFTAAGHITCRLKLNALDSGEAHVTVELQDTGIGLSPEQQHQVFTAFSQADASTSREYGGTGLGLVIVKRLIEQMGGECGVKSKQGKGATFWFNLSLPYEQQAQPARDFKQLAGRRVALYDADELTRGSHYRLLKAWGLEVTCFDSPSSLVNSTAQEEIAIISLGHQEQWPVKDSTLEYPCIFLAPEPEILPTGQQANCLSVPYSHLRLFDVICDTLTGRPPQPEKGDPRGSIKADTRTLIVDDNATNRQMLSLLLGDLGIQATIAESGEKAIDLCKQQHFDLIFMDLHMPQIDGIQATREIRRNSQCQQSQIIALSAYPSPDDPAALRNAGFNQFFSKPISSRALQHIYSEISEVNTSPPQSLHPVDYQGCLALAQEKPDLAEQMLVMLLDSLVPSRQHLQDAIAENNRDRLHEIVHQLCGACSYVAVPALKNRAENLLKCLKENAEWSTLVKEGQAVITSVDALLTWREEHDLETLFELASP